MSSLTTLTTAQWTELQTTLNKEPRYDLCNSPQAQAEYEKRLNAKQQEIITACGGQEMCTINIAANNVDNNNGTVVATVTNKSNTQNNINNTNSTESINKFEGKNESTMTAGALYNFGGTTFTAKQEVNTQRYAFAMAVQRTAPCIRHSAPRNIYFF